MSGEARAEPAPLHRVAGARRLIAGSGFGAPQTVVVAAMYALVVDAIVALYLGDVLGPSGVGLVTTAVAGSLWQVRLRAPLAQIRGGATVPGLIAGLASIVDLLYFAPTVLDGLIHLLLFLLLYRLYTRETLRDVRDIGFVCFFLLVAAAPVAFDVGFLFVFVAFLLAGTAVLMLRHVLGEADRAARATTIATGAVPIRGRHVFVLSVVAAAATLVITATLFFLIPRIGQAALPLRAKMGRMVSGFSERVSLGSFGEIETDSAVVMRVYVPEETPSPELLRGVRWRGIALDRFDGRVWTREDPDRYSLRRTAAGTFEISRPRGGGVLLAQEIYLEPIGTDVVFGAPRMLRLALRVDTITVDSASSVSVGTAAARLRYIVESELEPAMPRRAPNRRLDDDDRTRYLQLPPLASRIAALAGEVTRGSADGYDAAKRLTAHLSAHYRYSLALERTTGLPPVEEFLFVSRSGKCEYFAAGLAVMLRSVGIPARVVNGFQRGEWNPYGRYFMVRLLDAHSWVEAWIDDVGWVTFDPSPRGDVTAASAAGPVNLYLDALRLRWYRYIVNWSLTDQIQAASGVRRAARTWSPGLDWLRDPRDFGRPAAASLAAVVVVVTVLIVRQVRSRSTATSVVPTFYARALSMLARRGLVPEAGETAREFLRRATGADPTLGAPLAALTGGYERARFGGASLPSDELRRLEGLVEALTPSGRVTTPLMRNAPSSGTTS
jgi:transglutaminase-like putative cysteine protease